ncbi:MAG TPA: hypothetical protein DD435_16930 [Cyanobacteria bacterium UBA8530]|nr:hypothetical protein [Cyanobacteria bacterium UBA8530]
MYGGDYSFRTAASDNARRGTSFFLQALEEVAPKRRFRCVLEVGCNDLYLLEQLKERADRRIGIDPVWAARESKNLLTNDLTVIGQAIEEVDLGSLLPEAPDLILCRHTLEHLFDPKAVIRRLLDIALPETILLFEVPGVEALLNRNRFDQVFHQHLHYFGMDSLIGLLNETGAELIASRCNYLDWGALLVAFRKGKPQARPEPAFGFEEIRERYRLFQQQARTVAGEIESMHRERLFGYGAAQMLPVLNFHLGGALERLEAVLDDDWGKDGLFYQNVPLIIRHPSQVGSLRDSTLVLTALDGFRSIMNRVLDLGPRHVVFPHSIL